MRSEELRFKSEELKIDDEKFLEQYLAGKAPLHADRLNLPSKKELDAAEAEFDKVVAERKRLTRLYPLWPWIGAVAAGILLLLVFRFGQEPRLTSRPDAKAIHEPVVEQPVIAETIEKSTPQPATQPVIEEKKEEKPQKPNEANEPNKSYKPYEPHKSQPQPQQLATVSATSDTEAVKLSTSADSLYYYLTQLENQMGDCRDSTCLAELSNLMRADEKIKTLVNKIIHKQVETAYQEEYLVDTTTHYIPL